MFLADSNTPIPKRATGGGFNDSAFFCGSSAAQTPAHLAREVLMLTAAVLTYNKKLHEVVVFNNILMSFPYIFRTLMVKMQYYVLLLLFQMSTCAHYYYC